MLIDIYGSTIFFHNKYPITSTLPMVHFGENFHIFQSGSVFTCHFHCKTLYIGQQFHVTVWMCSYLDIPQSSPLVYTLKLMFVKNLKGWEEYIQIISHTVTCMASSLFSSGLCM